MPTSSAEYRVNCGSRDKDAPLAQLTGTAGPAAPAAPAPTRRPGRPFPRPRDSPGHPPRPHLDQRGHLHRRDHPGGRRAAGAERGGGRGGEQPWPGSQTLCCALTSRRARRLKSSGGASTGRDCGSYGGAASGNEQGGSHWGFPMINGLKCRKFFLNGFFFFILIRVFGH